MTVTKSFVEANGSKAQVKQIYESYSGWYWYITDDKDWEEQFGLVKGFETEWGYVWMPELDQQIQKGRVWKVPKKNWFGCPLVKSEKDE